jgi:Uma2 family endonuclease
MTIAVEPDVWPSSVVINDISWDLYQKLLKAVGEQTLRLTYDDGVLEIISPLSEHEKYKKMIGRLIEALSVELEIPISAYGSTTFKRRSLKSGLEPDECYYVQREREMRWNKRIDLKRDPPPDLVVEVDLSYRTVDKRRIYAQMRTPEIWSYDSGNLEFLHLKRGKYEARATSLAFPFLKPSDIQRYIGMLGQTDDSSIIRRWQNWLRRNHKR